MPQTSLSLAALFGLCVFDVATQWKIHKFGGTSLADAACFSRVADILARDHASAGGNLGVVVSAMGGMTDALLQLVSTAEGGGEQALAQLERIGARYSKTVGHLVEDADRVTLLDQWSSDAADLKTQLAAISSARVASPLDRDITASYGELWSARLLAAVLKARLGPSVGGTWVDARDVVVIRHGEMGPQVLWETAQRRFDRRFEGFSGIAVITGFVAVDEQGQPTTLGRNGSDYSAAIFAKLADAIDLTIWTDVDGVLSGDPRRIPEAQVIPNLSYNEAMELAYFGAKVIHPQTMGPAVERNIPVVIRNSLAPDEPGSRISGRSRTDSGIKGVTAVDNIAIVNLEGAGMIGVPGTADRLFAALKAAGVSVSLISQASSEHSICIAVPNELADRAQRVIAEAFADELETGQIHNVDIKGTQSIIAVVGDNMAGTPGVAARFFGTLGSAGINVGAIAQGSSERNISAVVRTEESTRALRAVHAGFYLSAKTVSVGLIGPGNVGAELLGQIERRSEWLRESFNLDLRVRAIARSQTQLSGQPRIDLSNWQAAFDSEAKPLDFDAFEAHVHPDHLPHAVIIDCTSSDAVAKRYAGWLERGIHVITPNKKAFSGDLSYYEALRTSAQQAGSQYFYETTVGAALPIISTLRNLLDTGDRVRSIDGILSGTLAYLFNVYDGTTPFSQIVSEARASGYTEPDPRDDLSGMDVARKITILARELGYDVAIGDFPVESLIPEPLRELSTDQFLEQLADYDDAMAELYADAQRNGKKLRYLASLDDAGQLEVGLRQVGPDSALSHVQLTDNIVRFTTNRYADNPLVVQGPGAGPAVTAGGVFGDLLRLAQQLGRA